MRLKVGGVTYEVVYQHILDNCGEVRRERNEIVIEKDLPDDQKLLTLLHELLHCINGELSETDVDYLATALHGIIADNNLGAF